MNMPLDASLLYGIFFMVLMSGTSPFFSGKEERVDIILQDPP